MLNKNFFTKNRKKLQDKLENNSIVFVYSGMEIPQESNVNLFFPNSNYYYLTGLDEPDQLLVLLKDQDGILNEFLFIPQKNPNLEKWHGYKMSIEDAKDKTDIDNIFYVNDKDEILPKLFKENPTTYIDESLQIYEKDWINGLKEFTNEFKNIDPIIGELRLIKEAEEIEEIRQAGKITGEAILEVMKSLKPDEFEYVPASLFEYQVKKRGAQDLSFPTIAASGKNGVILHYVKNNNKINDGDLILFDLGAKLNGYCADVSRTFPVNGKFTKTQLKFYKALLKTQKELIKEYKRGVSLRYLQELTKKHLEKNLKEQGIVIPKSGINEWYYHSIGHSLGIDTHDNSNRDLILENGMIITCEPGVYSKEDNIGIRIEDDILINDNNPIVLTDGIPKEINDIYKYMNQVEE